MALTHSTVATGTNDGTKQVSKNAWNADHTIDTGGATFATGTGTPTTPSAGNVVVFGKTIANRAMPAWVGPSGLDTDVQPFLARNKVGWYQPQGNSSTTPVITGLQFTTYTGTATARNVATTNALTRMRRIGIVSAATAGSFSHTRLGATTTGIAQFTTGDAATYALGGFHYVARFGISDAATVSGARMFVGMSSSTSAPTNVEPSTLTNCVGMAQLSTDSTQLYLVYGGSSAQTAIALGSTNFSISTAVPYELALFAPAGVSATIYYQATNLANGTTTSGTLSGGTTIIPNSTTLLAPHFWRTNNATALAVGIDICNLYVETDQ